MKRSLEEATMKNLISNEILKLKRQFFLIFAIILTLVPVITGGFGAIISGGKNYYDLFFFINNQYSMFYLMVAFIVVSTLFYIEYKNKMYITWICYDYKKSTLFWSKIFVSMIISLAIAFFLLVIFVLLVLGLSIVTGLQISTQDVFNSMIGFLTETLMIIPISTMFGSIVINLSRNMVISSIVGIFYGFVSCMFIGADVGRLVPGAFAYRICMFILEQNTFYDDPIQSIKIGITSYLIVGFIVSLVAILIFNQKKKIER